MNWYKRLLINDRAYVHLRIRECILYEREQLYEHDKYYDDLWNEAAAEWRCSERMKKLLNRYR